MIIWPSIYIKGTSDIHVIAINGTVLDPEKFEKPIESMTNKVVRGVAGRELV